MKVAVVTPWIDHPELIPGYAAAVERADQVIVVNNGSSDLDPAFLSMGWTVTKDYEALGFAASNNLGMEFADADTVVFLNNDVQGDPEWIDTVRSQVEDGALYGPSIGQQRVAGVVLPYVEGWCVAATRATWEKLSLESWIYGENGPVHRQKVGPWDAERFPKPYWEDVELSLRATLKGVELRRAPWPLMHLGGVSTSTVPGAWDGFEEQRRTLEAQVSSLIEV